jgi:hypothetical protein
MPRSTPGWPAASAPVTSTTRRKSRRTRSAEEPIREQFHADERGGVLQRYKDQQVQTFRMRVSNSTVDNAGGAESTVSKRSPRRSTKPASR